MNWKSTKGMFESTILFEYRVDSDANYVAKRRRNCESVTRVVNQYIAYTGQYPW